MNSYNYLFVLEQNPVFSLIKVGKVSSKKRIFERFNEIKTTHDKPFICRAWQHHKCMESDMKIFFGSISRKLKNDNESFMVEHNLLKIMIKHYDRVFDERVLYDDREIGPIDDWMDGNGQPI